MGFTVFRDSIAFFKETGRDAISWPVLVISIRPREFQRQHTGPRMLSSPLVRRMLLLCGGIGVFSLFIICIVVISVPSTGSVDTLRWRVLLSSCVLLAVGLIIVTKMTQRWLIPLVELKQGMEVLTESKRPIRIAAEYDDELGDLVRSYNEMSQVIDARITELQQSQQRVASDNEQLATVLEAMVEGVIAVDQDERILLANMAAIRLLDLKTYDAVGRRVWEAIRIPQIQDLIRKTLTESEQQRLEFAVPWTYSTVAVVASRLPGTPCPGAVLVLHDVTDLRRLENLRRDFVSNVSHELKTPLAAITAYAETLMNGALDDKDVSVTFVQRICEQAERLNSLILDLLELARIESGEHVYQVMPVDVNEVLKSSLDAHQAIALTKQLQVKTEFAAVPIIGMADPDGLRTIADNLIGNAIKYTQSDGTITIRTRRDGKSVEFDVEDSGVGIAKEYQSRIFERFFRIDRARSREEGGTGLGLSIVKHLCQLFGGTIKLKSQLGQGSMFTISLEAATD